MNITKLSFLALLLAGHASASLITFTDQAAFLAAIAPGYYQETFAFASSSFPVPLASPQSLSGNGFSYQISAANGLASNFGFVQAANSPDALIVSSFGGGITALGGNFFYDNGGSVASGTSGTLTASNGIDPDAVMNISTVFPEGHFSFFGFISTSGPLTSVSTFRTTTNSNFPGFAGIDNLIVGTAATPEPGSFALLSLGLVTLAYFWRRHSAA
ncbi:MAG: PEP-CTERM sorting domain-containing protein [Acidobacteriota bacterium]